MDLLFLSSAFVIFFVSILVIKLTKKNGNQASLKLPPGPRPLPIIGNMHQLYGGIIHRKLRDLVQKYGPVMHLQMGEVLTIVVTSPEAARDVYKTHDAILSQRPSCFETFRSISYDFTDILFAPYGNYWRELRKICTVELLSPKRVQTFSSIREDEVLNLMKSISSSASSSNNKGGGSVIINLSKMIFSLTYSITSRAAFGKRSEDQEKFERLIMETTELVAGFSISDLYPSSKLLRILSGMEQKLQKIHKQVDKILENILGEHKQQIKNGKIINNNQGVEAREDLVDVLLRIQKNGDFGIPLTDDNIKAVIFNIFSAGSETSSAIVEWAISETLRNPTILRRAQEEVRNVFGETGNVEESGLDELKYIQAIVKETLRLHPSAPLLLPRENSEQCKIYGYDIPIKARIIVNAWALGRDPSYWNEPEKFNPERFLLDDSEIDYRGNDFQYIPFGAGRRICPGIYYSQPNILLPFAQLLFHFDWKLPGELKLQDLDMDESMGVTVRRKSDLCLIPMLHQSSFLNKEI